MELIYKGDYLQIDYLEKDSLFIQYWNPSPDNIEDFKSEMLEYTNCYKEFKPTNSIWIQQNFSLILDEETKKWIEIYVNRPCYEHGNRKCAFIVSRDVIAHIHTIDVFEKTNSYINVKHFATKEEAMVWIKDTDNQSQIEIGQKFLYEGIDEEGKVVIKIETDDIKQTLKNLHKSIELGDFLEKHKQKAKLLTKRETEILKLLSQDSKHEEIAKLLYISVHTLRTHLKNIRGKLNFNSELELTMFAKILD